MQNNALKRNKNFLLCILSFRFLCAVHCIVCVVTDPRGSEAGQRVSRVQGRLLSGTQEPCRWVNNITFLSSFCCWHSASSPHHIPDWNILSPFPLSPLRRQSHRQKRQSHPGDCGQVGRGPCQDRGRQRQKASPRGGRQAGGWQGRHCQQQRGEWTDRLLSQTLL